MKIGVRIEDLVGVSESIKKVSELGIHSCQLCSFDTSYFTRHCAREIRDALERYGVSVSTFWAGWSGPAVWDFIQGPSTLGLVPQQYRKRRVEELKAGSDFAKLLGVGQVATHVGFIPENPNDPLVPGLVEAVRAVALHCKANGQKFLFETGQETPVTLLRTIQMVDADNLGINMDTANPILYGKANPVDMLDILGKYVCDVHIKDGMWPTDGWRLGEETPVGKGRADFRTIISRLKALRYEGAFTIEREIRGDEQIADIILAKEMLENLLKEKC